MLHVIYEAATDLEPGKPVDVTEGRGLLRIRIAAALDAPTYTQALNRELNRVLDDGAEWYQVWRDRVISPKDPVTPIRIEYRLDEDGKLDEGDVVEIREHKGRIEIIVDPSATVTAFAAAVNPAIAAFLSGGQWFQHWQGEIIDTTSPEDKSDDD